MYFQVKADLPKYAEIVFCVGFFIVYIADEIVHFFCGEPLESSESTPCNRRRSIENQPIPSGSRSMHYGSDLETQSLLIGRCESTENTSQCGIDEEVIVNPGVICNPSNQENCDQNIISILGLLSALSLHSFLEGLAIGVQANNTQVFLLLLAVSSHKFVVAFCLGVQLRANANASFKYHLFLITFFSMMSVLGILIGLFMNFQSSESVAIPVLQGLAGGTLLYVTVCEVLPQEKARWHKKSDFRAAGIVQLFSVMCGFTMMTLLNLYLGIKHL